MYQLNARTLSQNFAPPYSHTKGTGVRDSTLFRIGLVFINDTLELTTKEASIDSPFEADWISVIEFNYNSMCI